MSPATPTHTAWPAGDGQLVYIERLVFGSAMVVSIVLALDAIRRRDFASHGAWMTRGYAIGLGAGWAINVVVAGWIVRRGRARPSAVLATVP